MCCAPPSSGPWPMSGVSAASTASIQSRAVGQQYDNGNISSRRQERFPGEVPVFSGAVPLRSVCRFAREAAVALLPARLWLSPWRSGLSDDVPRARRVRSALPGVAGTDPARPHLQGLVPATARGAALRPWRRRGRGHCCRVNHDYVNKQFIGSAGESRGSAQPAPVVGAGCASWYGSGALSNARPRPLCPVTRSPCQLCSRSSGCRT